MLMISILLFATAAVLGAYLLSFVLRNQTTPKSVALLHGPIAATGLLLLIIYAIVNKPAPIISIIIFILAAMGGLLMIYRDFTGRSVPKWLAVGHGITALIGFALLLVFTFHTV